MSAARINNDLGQNTTGAVEGWHSSFKSRNALTKKRLLGRRPDWLVALLVGEIDEHYAHLGRAKAAGVFRAAQSRLYAAKQFKERFACNHMYHVPQ